MGAAAFYYKELATRCDARGLELDLVMVHAETPRVFEYVQAGNRHGLAAYLAEFVARMKAAGAEYAVIPSVTTHFAMRELGLVAPLPVLDIFTPLAEEIARRRIRRLAVFGTRFVMESEMYGFVRGAEFVRALPSEEAFVHETYVRLALDGHGTPAQFEGLRELAHRLCKREELDAVVMGGTDLSLIFNPSNTDFPHLDCAALHLASVEATLFGGA